MCEDLRNMTRELIGILDSDNSGYCWIKTFSGGEWSYGVTDTYINDLVHEIRVELDKSEEELNEEDDDADLNDRKRR